MEQIKTLTVGGQSYAIAHLDDTKVADGGWSAKKLIDTLCPAFTVSGKEVSCNPVAGYPLEIESVFVPAQTDTPSFDNPCPIQGKQRFTLLHNGQEITASLDETVYGGRYNWQTGQLTLTHGIYTMTGQERYFIYGNYFFANLPTTISNSGTKDGVCSHGPYNGYQSGCWCANYNAAIYAPNGDYTVDDAGLQAFQAAVAAQCEAGTPVQLCYKLTTPIVIQAAPCAVFAQAGENVFSAEEEITVRGRRDLQTIWEGVMA